MSDNKKYYYIRLKENFFDSEEIVVLESMKDGYLYSNILLKLYLKSLKFNGKVMLTERIPYSTEMIATLIRHEVGTVEKALRIFQELGLVEILDNGEIYMLDIQNFVGTSSTEADRRRKSDRELAEKKKQLIECGDFSEISTPEIRDKSINTIAQMRIESDQEKRCMSNECCANDYAQTENCAIDGSISEAEQLFFGKELEKDEIPKFNKETAFEKFWRAYPKKKDKARAKKSFIKKCKSEEMLKTMIEAVEKQKDSKQWKEANGQYIPHPSTWLNGERWEDELEPSEEKEAEYVPEGYMKL